MVSANLAMSDHQSRARCDGYADIRAQTTFSFLIGLPKPLPSKLNDKNASFMHKGASRTEMAMNADMNSSARYGREQVPGRLDQTVIDEGLRQHMLRVYNYMGLGLVLTGVVAVVVGTTPALYVPIFSTPLKWVVILAPLAFVFLFAFRIQTISASGAQMLFWAFCAIMGLSLASIFLVFTGTSIARTFFIAAAMFGATSLYGYTTKRDLSQFGSFLIMGLIGVVIASLVNLFLASSALQFIVSVVGILVFVGLTAWDTQSIKEQYTENFDADSNQKLAVFGALSLYLNFINIFQLLLNFTGDREG
jgi:FtsH-binding integral membrane protein